MGKSAEPILTGRNGAGRLLPSCFKRRSLGPAAVAQPSDIVALVIIFVIIRLLVPVLRLVPVVARRRHRQVELALLGQDGLHIPLLHMRHLPNHLRVSLNTWEPPTSTTSRKAGKAVKKRHNASVRFDSVKKNTKYTKQMTST